jgi:hypothetical protein
MTEDRMEQPQPEFEVSLSFEQLGELGLFNAIWSQIDTLVTIMMAKLAKTELGKVIVMTGAATTAPRIAMLRQLAEAAGETDLAKTCRGMGKLIGLRNHLSHGVWGIYWAADGSLTPACHYHGSPEKPIHAIDLPAFIADVAMASQELGKAMCRLLPELAIGERPRKFYFGPGDPNQKPPPPGIKRVVTEPVR